MSLARVTLGQVQPHAERHQGRGQPEGKPGTLVQHGDGERGAEERRH
jgi:hypothetical protein